MSVTVQSLKALARSLRSDTVTHSQALEIVAKRHGFKDWNAAAALAPKAPVLSNFEVAVAAIDGIGQRCREMQERNQRWRQTPEYETLLADIDAHIAWMVKHMDTERVAACMRYLMMHQHVLISFSRIPSFIAFTDQHRNLIMSAGDWINDVYAKYFPDLPQESPYARRKEPIGYGELVREVASRVKHDPGTTAEEVIAYLTRVHRGRTFNENTVRGLIKRGVDSVRSENRLLNRNRA